MERFDAHAGRLTVNGARYRLVTATHGPVHLVEVDGITHRVSRDEGGVLRAPAPALVVATPVAVGAEVEAGAPVLVLESMKMETVLPAPFDARVRELLVTVGSQVETGAPLIGWNRSRTVTTRRRPPAPGDRPRSSCPVSAAASVADARRRGWRTCAACCWASTRPGRPGPHAGRLPRRARRRWARPAAC